MERIPDGKYTKELREETVKLVTIQGHSIDEAVSSLCQCFNVSPGGYYQWQTSPPCTRQKEEARLEAEILAAQNRTRCTLNLLRKL